MNIQKIGRCIFHIVLCLLYFLIIACIGYGVAAALTQMRQEPLQTLPFVLFLFLGFMLQGLFHTLGHWCLGRLSGLQLIAVTFLRHTHVKEEKNFQTRPALPESLLSSCIMGSEKAEEVSYTPYWLGGVLLNLLTALLSLLVLGVSAWSLKSLPGCFLYSLFMAGLSYAVFNGLPIHHGKIPSDGLKVWQLKQHPEQREALQKDMQILALLSKGKTPVSEMPAACLEYKAAVSGCFSAALLLRQYEIQLWLKHRSEAKRLLALLYEAVDSLPEEMQNRIRQECIFLLSLPGEDPELADRLLTKSRKQRYEELASAESLRCLYAWARWSVRDEKAASVYEEAAMKAAAKTAFRPAAEAWKELLAQLRQETA